MNMTPPSSAAYGSRPGSSSALSPSTVQPDRTILGSAFENLLIPPDGLQSRPRSSHSGGSHRPGSRAGGGSRQLSASGSGAEMEEAFPVREEDDEQEEDEDGEHSAA